MTDFEYHIGDAALVMDRKIHVVITGIINRHSGLVEIRDSGNTNHRTAYAHSLSPRRPNKGEFCRIGDHIYQCDDVVDGDEIMASRIDYRRSFGRFPISTATSVSYGTQARHDELNKKEVDIEHKFRVGDLVDIGDGYGCYEIMEISPNGANSRIRSMAGSERNEMFYNMTHLRPQNVGDRVRYLNLGSYSMLGIVSRIDGDGAVVMWDRGNSTNEPKKHLARVACRLGNKPVDIRVDDVVAYKDDRWQVVYVDAYHCRLCSIHDNAKTQPMVSIYEVAPIHPCSGWRSGRVRAGYAYGDLCGFRIGNRCDVKLDSGMVVHHNVEDVVWTLTRAGVCVSPQKYFQYEVGDIVLFRGDKYRLAERRGIGVFNFASLVDLDGSSSTSSVHVSTITPVRPETGQCARSRNHYGVMLGRSGDGENILIKLQKGNSVWVESETAIRSQCQGAEEEPVDNDVESESTNKNMISTEEQQMSESKLTESALTAPVTDIQKEGLRLAKEKIAKEDTDEQQRVYEDGLRKFRSTRAIHDQHHILAAIIGEAVADVDTSSVLPVAVTPQA